VIARSAFPKLADKARLRLDKKTNQHVLLYPEKGLVLNRTGAAILQLCTGENSVEQIIERLQREHGEAPPAVIENEVLTFLDTLVGRGLVRVDP
jgi:pyrroloquinoline quinone biosynthesis protein D